MVEIQQTCKEKRAKIILQKIHIDIKLPKKNPGRRSELQFMDRIFHSIYFPFSKTHFRNQEPELC